MSFVSGVNNELRHFYVFQLIFLHQELVTFWQRKSGNCLLAVAAPLSNTDSCLFSNKPLKWNCNVIPQYVTSVWWRHKYNSKCQWIPVTWNILCPNKSTRFLREKKRKHLVLFLHIGAFSYQPGWLDLCSGGCWVELCWKLCCFTQVQYSAVPV